MRHVSLFDPFGDSTASHLAVVLLIVLRALPKTWVLQLVWRRHVPTEDIQCFEFVSRPTLRDWRDSWSLHLAVQLFYEHCCWAIAPSAVVCSHCQGMIFHLN